MTNKWIVKEINNEKVELLKAKFNLSNLVAKILSNRNILGREMQEDDIKKFLNPTRDDFYDPFLLPDMEQAVKRIEQAINNNEKILIYGDYDADGITSTTILIKFFKEIGVEVDKYIPNRLEEGYGINNKALEEIKNRGIDLIITVDTGITANDQVKYANELGLDVIITDHHEPSDEIPKAVAVIDAKRKNNKYPFNQLAGCGIAFKLTQAISIKRKLEPSKYLKNLDIVAIGTISDLVPLVDENRVIVKLGLMLVKQTKNIGLRKLLLKSQLREVDSTSISFGITPRINAAGRLGNQYDALNLFITEDVKEAERLSEILNSYNIERQKIGNKIYEEAISQLKDEEKNCIILGKEDWHHGVIGIVSSKITEKFNKPSILLCFEDNIAKGSGRSVPGFDLYKAISSTKEYLLGFGGHTMACGLSLTVENFEKFKKEITKYIDENVDISKLEKEIYIDEILTIDDLDIEEIKELKSLEPFGEENPEPIIMYENVEINGIRTLSENKHLKLSLKKNDKIIDAIGFNLGELAEKYKIGDTIDIVGNIEINSFNGKDLIQIRLIDIRKA
ncbi:MAG: single-stranded-DNA-specific exonuclease RecJ [Clostridiales bacterium]|nr:single-stranded-DNA-specific exonuclease RecJ [Clostridiales bacterium]